MLRIIVQGIRALQGKLDYDRLVGPPITRALTRSALTVEGGAKKLSPVDTGRLRASLTHRLEASPSPRYAEVGTDVFYARFVHEGTRRMRGRPFLRNALEQSREKIRGFFAAAGKEIEQMWRS